MQDSDRPQPAQAIGLRAWCVGSLIESQTGLSQQDTTMSFFSRKTRRDARVRSVRRTSPLRLESLEDRCLLADLLGWRRRRSNWNNALNWSTDQLPGPADDVTINVAGDVTIAHASGATAINSLVSHESIDFSGGSLSLNASSSVSWAVQQRRFGRSAGRHPTAGQQWSDRRHSSGQFTAAAGRTWCFRGPTPSLPRQASRGIRSPSCTAAAAHW